MHRVILRDEGDFFTLLGTCLVISSVCHCERSVAISYGKSAFVYMRLLHSVRNDNIYFFIVSEAWQSHKKENFSLEGFFKNSNLKKPGFFPAAR